MIIREFDFLQYKDKQFKNYISEKTFLEIEKFILDNEETAQYLKITTKRPFGKVLQAQNYVGIIQTKDGTTIEILPKIAKLTDSKQDEQKAKNILINMLKTLKESPFKNIDMANLKSSKTPLLEIFISMFLEELTKLVQRGLKSDYINKEDNLHYLKGKLKVSQQIKQNFIHKERFYVEYQEFITDRIENRLIKTTLNFLYKKSKSNNNKKRLREFIFVFDQVQISNNIKTDFDKVKVNRQMKDYEQILIWAKTFLLGNSYSPYKGNDVAFALLFDMNLLFESYVGSYLRKQGLKVKLQHSIHHLAYMNDKGQFRLKPDIVIEENDHFVIADTKWKLLSLDKKHQGISQSDMYQLYAYGTKYNNCKDMYLIYPKDVIENGNIYTYFKQNEDKNLNLKILFFDLEMSFKSKDFVSNFSNTPL